MNTSYFKRLLPALALGLAALCANAQVSEPALTPFFVSALLKLNGSEATVRIIQGMLITDTPEHAQLILKDQAARQYPAYTVLDCLAATPAELYSRMLKGEGVSAIISRPPSTNL